MLTSSSYARFLLLRRPSSTGLRLVGSPSVCGGNHLLFYVLIWAISWSSARCFLVLLFLWHDSCLLAFLLPLLFPLLFRARVFLTFFCLWGWRLVSLWWAACIFVVGGLYLRGGRLVSSWWAAFPICRSFISE